MVLSEESGITWIVSVEENKATITGEKLRETDVKDLEDDKIITLRI